MAETQQLTPPGGEDTHQGVDDVKCQSDDSSCHGNSTGCQGNVPGDHGDDSGCQGNTPHHQGDDSGCLGDTPGCQGDDSGCHDDTSCDNGGDSGCQGDTPCNLGDDSGCQGDNCVCDGPELHHIEEDEELLESDTDSETEILNTDLSDSEELEPPDGGYGWVVCASAFFLQLICDGLLFSFGVLYISLLEHFEEGKSTTSWVGAVFMGCSMLMGPLAGALAGKIGCRLTGIIGSVIASVSLVISTFSPNIAVLAFTYGAMAGTGLSLVYLVSVVMVGSYFKRRRALANGIAMCGSGIGTFIMSPLLRFLLDEYGWKGTILILAGIALNCCVFSSFFRPVVYKKVKKHGSDSRENLGNSVTHSENCDMNGKVLESEKRGKLGVRPMHKSVDDVPKTDSGYASNGNMGKPAVRSLLDAHQRRTAHRRPSSLTDISKYEKLHNKQLMAVKAEHQFSHPALTSGAHACSSKSLSVHSRILRNIITTQSLVDTYWGKENVSTMSRREIFISGSAWTMPRAPTIDHRSDKHSIYSQYSALGLSSVPKTTLRDTLRNWFLSGVNAFGFPLLNDPVLLLIVFSCVFWTGQSTIYTYLVDYALFRGIDKHNAAFLLSIIGITNTVARIAIGWLTDHPRIDSTLVYATALIISGVVAFAIPFCETFLLLAICSAVFGICMATYVSLRSIIVVDLLGIAKLTGGFGLVISFQGVTYTVVPPIAGAILESTGTYMGPFFAAGAFYTLAAIIILPVRFIHRRCREKELKDIPVDI